jgi:hypothetical protein
VNDLREALRKLDSQCDEVSGLFVSDEYGDANLRGDLEQFEINDTLQGLGDVMTDARAALAAQPEPREADDAIQCDEVRFAALKRERDAAIARAEAAERLLACATAIRLDCGWVLRRGRSGRWSATEAVGLMSDIWPDTLRNLGTDPLAAECRLREIIAERGE